MLGRSDFASQEEIVNQFSIELQKGTSDEGVPKNIAAIETVLIELGLSSEPSITRSDTSDYSDMPVYIQDHSSDISRMIIGTQHPIKHCMLIKEIVNGGVIVMSPDLDDFVFLSWENFMAMKPDVLVL